MMLRGRVQNFHPTAGFLLFAACFAPASAFGADAQKAFTAPFEAAGELTPRNRIDELSVGFGGLLALDQVSMSADQGEIVGVIGPNGAGKTTLFNVISGFVRSDSGVVTYDGTSLRHVHPHDLTKLGIAGTFQGGGLFAGLTVLENVMAGARAG